MAARLKVFATSDGLTDYVVAAGSRAKALAAWGVGQDLFKEGRAREVDDPDAVAAALARPGEVLRRPVPGGLPKVPPASAARPTKAGPSKAALQRIADAEADLAALDRDRRAEVAAFDRRRDELDGLERLAAERHQHRRAELEARLARARDALD